MEPRSNIPVADEKHTTVLTLTITGFAADSSLADDLRARDVCRRGVWRHSNQTLRGCRFSVFKPVQHSIHSGGGMFAEALCGVCLL
jgi:hypothetical protein